MESIPPPIDNGWLKSLTPTPIGRVPSAWLKNGECVLQQNCGKNAYRSAEGDCYCKKGYEMRNGKCQWPQNKNGFEIAPWKKGGCSGWQAQCNQGNGEACGKYEANCQVN